MNFGQMLWSNMHIFQYILIGGEAGALLLQLWMDQYVWDRSEQMEGETDAVATSQGNSATAKTS
jgi:hypothetical protein